MALLHWRKFIFFDEEFLKGTELNQLVSQDEPKNINPETKQPFVSVQLSCSSSGWGNILLGDRNGCVYMVNKFMKVSSFRANQKSTTHVKQVPKSPIFVTCGADQSGINPLIKIWNPEKTDRLNQPSCLRVIRANSGFTKQSSVTCIEFDENLTTMLVGYEDGSVVLFRGDITRQRRSKSTRPMKISDRAITGIVIHNGWKGNTNFLNQGSQIEITAYISTDSEVIYATMADKLSSINILDELGCRPRCSCFLPGPEGRSMSENLFAVGIDNAVYFYQTDGRGPCLAFEGEKLVLYRFKSYLVIVSREASGRMDNSYSRTRRPQSEDKLSIDLTNSTKRVSVNIYDIKKKYIAHSTSVPEVQEIFSEWGKLFVICTNGQVVVFNEKDTQTKLDTLFRKNQFGLVIDLAKSHQYNEDALTDIFKQYGDHLYRKGDLDGAIAQYSKTIGKSEPSYVIKKFLDSKRINHLTVYLEELHKKSCASQDHTKLLLNCYSKMRSDQQLKQFIESYEEGYIKLNVDIAIQILRDAGFYEIALDLAKKHLKHDWYLKIQLEDANNSDAALDYMKDMSDTYEMSKYMKEYGRKLLNDAPDKTISMIKLICEKHRANINSSQENYRNFGISNASVQILPEDFFHIFSDNYSQFALLLEQLLNESPEFATKAVHSALLELYLNAWRKESDDLMRSTLSDKIKKLLSQPGEKIDMDQALILCRNNRFDEGLVDLYSRAKLYHLILQYYIDQQDSLKIMKVCEQFGSEDPSLYMPALIFYSKAGDERLTQLLKTIDHQQVIPPMVATRIFLGSARVNLGLVRDYLARFLNKLHVRQVDNENAIDDYKGDTEVVRMRIEEFENHLTSFQPSKCSQCKCILDLPTVHFLCNHSFHQNCFHNYSAESDECPRCSEFNRKLLDEIGSHESSKSTLKKLEKQFSTPSDDMFISLAKLFGYGLFNQR